MFYEKGLLLKTVIFILIVIFVSYNVSLCQSKNSDCKYTSIVLNFIGCDTTEKPSKNAIVWTESVEKIEVLRMFCDYKKWKRAKKYKCYSNVRIGLWSSACIDSVRASFSNKCNYAVFTIDKKTICKEIPLELFEVYNAIFAKIPKKEGWLYY